MSITPTMMKHSAWRAAFLTALANFKLSTANATAAELRATLMYLASPIDSDDQNDDDGFPFVRTESTEDAGHDVVRSLTEALAFVMDWVDAVRKGDAGAAARLQAAHALAFTAAEEFPEGTATQFEYKARVTLQAIQDVRGLGDVPTAVQALQAVPVSYQRPNWRRQFVQSQPAVPGSDASEPYIVKVAIDVDGQPWTGVKVFQMGISYDVHAQITVPTWPVGAMTVRLEHITTLAPEQYQLHLPSLLRSTGSFTGEMRLPGNVTFHHPQSLSSNPLLLQMRATFDMEDGISKPGVLVGYYELRAHVVSGQQVPILSGYRSLDKRLVDLMMRVQSDLPDLDQQHLHDFVTVLSALCNFQGLNLQQGLYRQGENVGEAQFQARLLEHLRIRLGEDVQEAPRQGSGITDVQYRSVTVELKVERAVKDRSKVIDNYVSQPTQYTSAGGGQLGVLCVLDVTEKTSPPANAPSNLTLEVPALHGFEENPAASPARIAVVFIDGNLRIPSSYSR